MPRRDGGLGTHYYYLLPPTTYFLLHDSIHMRGAGAPLFFFPRESYQLSRPVQLSSP